MSTLTRRAARRRRGALRAETVELARKAYDALTPKDVLLRHAWLFQKHWVEESADEMDGMNAKIDHIMALLEAKSGGAKESGS